MSIADLQHRLDEPEVQQRISTSSLIAVAGDVRIAREKPESLAKQAGAALDEYSLARVLVSEGYGGARIGKAAAAVGIAQVVVELARLKRVSITELVTASTFPAAHGFYGEQRGRKVATTRDPTRWHLEIARAVLAREVPDLVHGATHFLDMAVFARGTQAGRDLSPFETVIRSWITGREKNTIRDLVPTIDPFHLLFLGPGPTVDREDEVRKALKIYEDGQRGLNRPTPGNPDGIGLFHKSVALVAAALIIGAFWWLRYT